MRVRPLESNTRIRTDHNTAGAIIRLAQPTDILTGENVFIAPNDLSNANGIFQKAGDRWLQVGENPEEWIAITNMGVQICEEVVDEPTEIYLKHTIEVYSNGSLVIDGIAYP